MSATSKMHYCIGSLNVGVAPRVQHLVLFIQISISLPLCYFSASPVGSQLSLISQPSMKSQSKLEVASSSSGRLNNCCIIVSDVYTLCMLLKTFSYLVEFYPIYKLT